MNDGAIEGPRDLVLGLAMSYDWPVLEPFVRSLLATDFAGEVHLFVADTDIETIRRLEHEGIIVHRLRSLRRRLFGQTLSAYIKPLRPLQALYPLSVAALSRFSRDPARARLRLTALLSIPHVARYLFFLDFLEQRPGQFKRVLLSDTRDVVFQQDPFAGQPDHGLMCFLEDRRVTIQDGSWNALWLQLAYGSLILDQLGDRPISCSGTTMGDAHSIVGYLRAMAREIMRLPLQMHGIDQGVHNYLVHSGKLPGARLLANYEGPVLTMGLMADDVGPESLLMPDGTPVNVVHQYDKKPLVAEHLKRLSEVRPTDSAALPEPG